MTIMERITEWPKPWIEQGIVQGREQGLVDQRALLGRQMASRFGAAGDRLAAELQQVSDAERLADVGEWIVSCSTAEELGARLAELRPVPVNSVSTPRRR